MNNDDFFSFYLMPIATDRNDYFINCKCIPLGALSVNTPSGELKFRIAEATVSRSLNPHASYTYKNHFGAKEINFDVGLLEKDFSQFLRPPTNVPLLVGAYKVEKHYIDENEVVTFFKIDTITTGDKIDTDAAAQIFSDAIYSYLKDKTTTKGYGHSLCGRIIEEFARSNYLSRFLLESKNLILIESIFTQLRLGLYQPDILREAHDGINSGRSIWELEAKEFDTNIEANENNLRKIFGYNNPRIHGKLDFRATLEHGEHDSLLFDSTFYQIDYHHIDKASQICLKINECKSETLEKVLIETYLCNTAIHALRWLQPINTSGEQISANKFKNPKEKIRKKLLTESFKYFCLDVAVILFMIFSINILTSGNNQIAWIVTSIYVLWMWIRRTYNKHFLNKSEEKRYNRVFRIIAMYEYIREEKYDPNSLLSMIENYQENHEALNPHLTSIVRRQAYRRDKNFIQLAPETLDDQ